ncbi:MAG: hypothetical protein JOY59_05660 [Candidatus Eremiobacteraeota bacterium]|nr:hypothetical protein [Candidatus Eremiobacteraeota bacterium]
MSFSAAIHRAGAIGVAFLALSAPFAMPALAQQGPPPGGGRHGNPMVKVIENIKPPLSDAQKSRIRAIYADARKQNENVTDRDQRRANMRKASEQIRALLGPEQQKSYDAQIKAMRARYQQQQQQGGGGR